MASLRSRVSHGVLRWNIFRKNTQHKLGLLQISTLHSQLPKSVVGALNSKNGHRFYHKSVMEDVSAHRIDMRSDTITVPTPRMRQAMADAAVGDDVYGEDPTVNELQEKIAALFGKESALFVPTGTMGNLIAVMAHCSIRGAEVLMGDMSHLLLYEQGGHSQIGGVHPRTFANRPDGTFDLDQVRQYIRPLNDAHYPITKLVCVENTHNYCGGKVIPLNFLAEIREIANEHNLGVHMDGARFMNAAVALGVEPSTVLQHVDTVSMCFSKGLGAPVGSIVAGPAKLMESGHRLRKALGGGMRQVGVLAAAAMVGLEEAQPRLSGDHKHAKQIAQAVNDYGCGAVSVDMEGVHTNIIMVNVHKPGYDAPQICDRLSKVTEEEFSATKERIVVSVLPFAHQMMRIVTNSNVTEEDVNLAIRKIKYVLDEINS